MHLEDRIAEAGMIAQHYTGSEGCVELHFTLESQFLFCYVFLFVFFGKLTNLGWNQNKIY